jgi:flagellar hook-length control protein FliK
MQALKKATNTNTESKLPSPEIKAMKELLNKTENTLARLVVDQLMSLPREETSKQIWHIEIPFMDKQKAETVRISIERDSSADQADTRKQWSVDITLTPPEIGTIHCKIAYRDETVSTHFRSNQQSTSQLINKHLEQLRFCFEAAGLKTGHMDVQHTLNTKFPAQMNVPGNNLVDEKT